MTATKSEPAFQTQPSGPAGRLDSRGYAVHRVGFELHGSTLAGNLFARKTAAPNPTIVIVGPVAFVKEQAPLQYAHRLAAMLKARFHSRKSGARGNLVIGRPVFSGRRPW